MLIKFKIYIIFGIIIFILLGTISGLVYWLKLTSDERDRHQQNYNVVQGNIKRFKDKTGANAITIQELQLTNRELRKSGDSTIQSLLSENRNLGNSNKHLEQLLSVKVSTEIREVIIPIHDTIIIREDKPNITRIASISSEWLSADIAVYEDKLELISYQSRDEIIIVLKWYKNGRWFLSRWFEKRKYAADIKSRNTNSNITSAENIRVTGKRGR